MNDTANGGARELEPVLLEASRLVEDGEGEHALRLLLDAEREHSTDATLLCMVGVVADHLGAEGIAVDYFRRCLAQDPIDPEVLVQAGAGLAGTGDPAAEPALRLAAITAPGYAPARLHYGSYLVRSGLLEQGLEELSVARALDPGDPVVRRETAIAYLLAGREREARVEMESAVDADPEDAGSRLLHGLLLVLEGEVSGGAEELYTAGAALEDDGEAQLVLALTFALEGWTEEAWLALSRAESAGDSVTSEAVREVEEALEDGEEAIRELLLSEVAPTLLRSRVHSR